MRHAPTNSDDLIDSREIIERIEELEEDREALETAAEEATDAIDDAPADDSDEIYACTESLAAAQTGLREWNDDNGAELAALQSLQSEAEGYADDWRHGATLIRDSYFETYAQEFADDIGAVDRNASWPLTCIDWEQAARELQADYTSVEFGGITYWVR